MTDRARLASGADAGLAVAALVALIDEAARAGVDLIQIRERDLEARVLAEIVERSLSAVQGTEARVLVNDRLDVALAAGAHGVHLRAGSIDAARAREIAPPEFLIGRSVHSAQEASAVAGREGLNDLDYLLLGTIFSSASKAGGGEPLGAGELARAAHAVALPVLAIGGVTLDVMSRIGRTGAAGFAAIGLFASVGAGAGRGSSLAHTVTLARRMFDTSRPVT